VDAAGRQEIVAGVFAPHPDRAAEMAARGFRFVVPAVDADLLRHAAADALLQVRTGVPHAEQTDATSG
jgi:2-keto-3-deoxy-L-rhamnonate aldolase RhmA